MISQIHQSFPVRLSEPKWTMMKLWLDLYMWDIWVGVLEWANHFCSNIDRHECLFRERDVPQGIGISMVILWTSLDICTFGFLFQVVAFVKQTSHSWYLYVICQVGWNTAAPTLDKMALPGVLTHSFLPCQGILREAPPLLQATKNWTQLNARRE